jgi:hypothetical protein
MKLIRVENPPTVTIPIPAPVAQSSLVNSAIFYASLYDVFNGFVDDRTDGWPVELQYDWNYYTYPPNGPIDPLPPAAPYWETFRPDREFLHYDADDYPATTMPLFDNVQRLYFKSGVYAFTLKIKFQYDQIRDGYGDPVYALSDITNLGEVYGHVTVSFVGEEYGLDLTKTQELVYTNDSDDTTVVLSGLLSIGEWVDTLSEPWRVTLGAHSWYGDFSWDIDMALSISKVSEFNGFTEVTPT